MPFIRLHRFQSVQQSFERQNTTLDEARRVLAETEEMGQGILIDLAEQKEVIQRAQTNVCASLKLYLIIYCRLKQPMMT